MSHWRVIEMILTFKKEKSGNWFFVAPEYPGPKDNLLMVAGADKLLDCLLSIDKRKTSKVKLCVYENKEALSFYNHYHAIHKGNGYYSCDVFDDFWLCDVTEWVFGHYPENLYFYQVF